MISKHHRFSGLGSLRYVFARGNTIRGGSCSLRYHLNQRRDTFRVAVVVSRKVHKSAVVRNRIRRRIYEIVRSQQSSIAKPYDLVITVYSDQLATLPSKELHSLITGLFKKAGVLQ